jgi:hypothetical protein
VASDTTDSAVLPTVSASFIISFVAVSTFAVSVTTPEASTATPSASVTTVHVVFATFSAVFETAVAISAISPEAAVCYSTAEDVSSDTDELSSAMLATSSIDCTTAFNAPSPCSTLFASLPTLMLISSSIFAIPSTYLIAPRTTLAPSSAPV